VLFAILLMGGSVLQVWYTPAFAATDRLLQSVDAFLVPAYRQWLQ
jgi:hypothetical protein